jgi:hypothetical protein
MSEAFLNKILDEVVMTLNEDLRDELNYLETSARFTPDILLTAIFDQLRFTSVTMEKDDEGNKTGKVVSAGKPSKYPVWDRLTENQKKFIESMAVSRAEETMGRLRQEFLDLQNKTFQGNKLKNLTINVIGDDKDFTVVAITNDRDDLTQVWRGRGNQIDLNSFNVIKEGYRDAMNDLWQQIGQYIEMTAGEKERLEKTAFNLTHTPGGAVAERRVGRSITELYNKVKAQAGTSDARTRQIFKELGLEVFLKYVSTIDETRVETVVGGRSKNQSVGATVEKFLIETAEKQIIAAVRRQILETPIPELAGSDDRVTIEKKKIVKAFNESLRKDLKKKSIDTKLNLSKKTTKKKPVKAKVKRESVKKAPIKKISRDKVIATRNRKRTSAISNVALIAAINRKLPQTVAKNMGTPRLNYRSGRFANSVQVTDIASTPQGYPSIGYTYQQRPYQTFEPGYKQGSTERDPRKLIDTSIREIALELIVGRFYTRRV